MQNDATKSALAGASGFLALAITTPSAAQESDNREGGEDLEEVVISGLRVSLQRNLDIKRESVGVVDAISAPDAFSVRRKR